MEAKKETILVFCAHNDDQILGVGGTLAKYAQEGKHIIAVIFSFGESSHIWLQRKEIVETRVKESHRADKLIGIEQSSYLGIKEGSFSKQIEKMGILLKIKKLIKKYNPSKIFTHAMDDPHPDHRAVNKAVLEVIDDLKKGFEVYTFAVWNPITIFKRNNPRLVVDITDTLNKKVTAFQLHESQKLSVIILLWGVYVKAYFHGLTNKTKYAELFYKVR